MSNERMRTEREKMLAGALYDALDPGLIGFGTGRADHELRRHLCLQLFGTFCDYGSNIELGGRVFFNFNCVVLDVCRVQIGDFTMLDRRFRFLTPLPARSADRLADRDRRGERRGTFPRVYLRPAIRSGSSASSTSRWTC